MLISRAPRVSLSQDFEEFLAMQPKSIREQHWRAAHASRLKQLLHLAHQLIHPSVILRRKQDA
jgi:hypothetical protein